MKVLVLCEESQAVTNAFRKNGHEAYSCDLKPCTGGHYGWHIIGDAFDAIGLDNWDLIIMHPPCTALSVSGNSTYAEGKPKHSERIAAVKWTQALWDKAISVCDRVCMENPVGVLNTLGSFPKPQFIQPYNFGHDASKKTGLWLHGLNRLRDTKFIPGRVVDGVMRWENQTDSGQNKLSPSEERATLRSKTYHGIADAMAIQWGKNRYRQLELF